MEDKLTRRFWQSVAAVMAFRDLSDADLARLVGMERSALNSKKNGKRRTTLGDVERICEALPEVRVSVGLTFDGLTDNRQYQSTETPSEQGISHTLSHLAGDGDAA